jgi:hypothetical protein
MHDKLTVANISQAGARAASTQGNDAQADYMFVQAADHAAAAMSRSKIQYIVLYKAAAPSDRVPTSCAAGTSQLGLWNVYAPTDLSATSSSFGCAPTALDRFWCPASRKVAESAAGGGPPDYVGVYVKVRHDHLTGLFPSEYTFTDDTVLRIEARKK